MAAWQVRAFLLKNRLIFCIYHILILLPVYILVLCLVSQPFKTNYSIPVFKRTLRCKKNSLGEVWRDSTLILQLRAFWGSEIAPKNCVAVHVFKLLFRSMISQKHVRYMVCSVIGFEDCPGNYDFEKSMLFGWVVFFNAWFNTVLAWLRKIEQLPTMRVWNFSEHLS